MRLKPGIKRLLLVAGLSLTMAACGDSGSPETADVPGTPGLDEPAATATATEPVPEVPAAATFPDPCTLLSYEEVAALTGVVQKAGGPIKGVSNQGGTTGSLSCVWLDRSDYELSIRIGAMTRSGFAKYQEAYFGETVTGYGGEAAFTTSRSVHIFTRGLRVEIGASTQGDEMESIRKVAEVVLPRL
jgi:hypothetical protein